MADLRSCLRGTYRAEVVDDLNDRLLVSLRQGSKAHAERDFRQLVSKWDQPGKVIQVVCQTRGGNTVSVREHRR